MSKERAIAGFVLSIVLLGLGFEILRAVIWAWVLGL